jgi:putative transposase
LLALVRPSWFESGRVYGYRKVHHDLRALGETCSRHRVARLMRGQGWRAQVGYRRRPGFYGGVAHNVVTNVLDRQFDVAAPNMAWVTDITYIRTYEGWLYLAVVVDLFSRQVVGWSMDSRMSKDLVLQALLAAVWRRKPAQNVMVHSDQGSQFTSYEWAAFLASHNLQPSMSRRGNCHDNAVAESFFQLLKRERIKRKIYSTRELARQDIFDYIEMFYNPIRRHGHAANLSPVNYERPYFSEATNCL